MNSELALKICLVDETSGLQCRDMLGLINAGNPSRWLQSLLERTCSDQSGQERNIQDFYDR